MLRKLSKFTLRPSTLAMTGLLLAAALGAAYQAPAQAQDARAGNHPAHVHGVARLDAALEGNTLTFHLDSPLANLVGFEHVPSSAADKQAVELMARTLRDVTRMFATDAAAGCKIAEIQLTSPVLTPALLGENAPATGEAPPRDGHADLDGDFTLVCASPGALTVVDASQLLGAFPGLQRIDVQLATPKKQGAFQLAPGNGVIPIQ
ncbi:DUF2796 domain-containing protein [Herbaspirillum sp. alder98]|uniref:DUF2796 domain-containing protein n=1 Tax=Herbaspirillum sp. alder98 TaxID=2913096 RepID=UPI001CD90754|nr:DUF2796 domain-containing protein [Herbaspirillum sp. alder98]MCA1323011.1 DUF2796 domain-containing protein [Herbaspirillum sp. alder98]